VWGLSDVQKTQSGCKQPGRICRTEGGGDGKGLPGVLLDRVTTQKQAGKVMMAKARVGRCQPSCWSEGPGNGQNGGTHREREARAAEECKSKDGAANRCNNNPPKHGIGGGCWDF